MNRKQKIVTIITSISICILIIISCFAVNINGKKLIAEEEGEGFYDGNNVISSPYIPSYLSFADENVPLHIYWVKERLDREIINTVYQHSRTLQTLKRVPRFFPVIEKILEEEGVPEDFKYLCVAESNLENVISPAKATGYWQFLESTAKSYGLIINEEVDERYDLEKSTKAACKYLKDSKKRLGSWSLAAAAYNMGEARLKKSIEQQKTDLYWNLHLNSETSRYVYRILAYKQVFENPEIYGIKVSDNELYHPVDVMDFPVNQPINDLYLFCEEQEITFLELKILNPWLRNSKLTTNHQRYILKMPKK